MISRSTTMTTVGLIFAFSSGLDLGYISQAAAQNAVAEPQQQRFPFGGFRSLNRWEYRAVEFYSRDKPSEHTKKLNELAAGGWEYAGMIQPAFDSGARFAPKSVVAFRRAKPHSTLGVSGPISRLSTPHLNQSSEDAAQNADRAVVPKQSVQIHQLMYSRASHVAEVLSALNHPDVTVEAYPRTNQILIRATQPRQQEIAELIEQLDKSKPGESVSIVRTSKIDPEKALLIVRKVFEQDNQDAPLVEADVEERRLLIRGSAEQVRQIRNLVAGLEWLMESNSSSSTNE